MRILVHDFSGHPFPAQLSRELARRGNTVLHTHCTSYTTGKGDLERRSDDPDDLRFTGIGLGAEFAKYRPLQRIRQEMVYGRLFAKVTEVFQPDVILSGNVPLLAHARIARRCRRKQMPYVFWQQDIYSLAMGTEASKRLGPLGKVVGAWFERLERHVAREARAVVAISPDFWPVLRAWGVAEERVHVIPNWAPLAELPTRAKDNPWSQAAGLADRPVVLYAGTLGLKHDTGPLLEIARALRDREDGAVVVVVSSGTAADRLREQAGAEGLSTLLVLGFQPYEALPDVLGSGDVLVALLEPEASAYSVPSKILTYLCAGRAIVAAIPATNLAARMVLEAKAGRISPPDRPHELVAAVLELLERPQDREALGRNARQCAEHVFDLSTIGDSFLAVLKGHS